MHIRRKKIKICALASLGSGQWKFHWIQTNQRAIVVTLEKISHVAKELKPKVKRGNPKERRSKQINEIKDSVYEYKDVVEVKWKGTSQ